MDNEDFVTRRPQLRQRAEKILQGAAPGFTNLSPQETQALIHELQVHQIELEMQNDELRTTQVELATAKYRYQDLYDFAPVGLLTLDIDGCIREANVALIRMLGLEAGQIITFHLSNAIAPASQDTYHFFFQGLRSTRQPQQCEVDLLAKPSTPSVIRLDGVTIQQTGMPDTYRIAITDMTEQRRLLNSVQQSEQRLSTILNSARDYAIFTLTPEGIIDGWSAGAEEIYGYAAADMMGQPWESLFDAQDQKRDLPASQLIKATTQGYSADNFWQIRKDGSRFFADGSIHTLVNPAEQIYGFTRIASDVTRQKLLQEMEHRQHHFAITLRNTAVGMSKSIKLEEVLKFFLDSVRQVVPYDGANIMLIEDDIAHVVSSEGYKAASLRLFHERLLKVKLPIREVAAFQQILETRRPVLIANTAEHEGWEARLQDYPPFAYLGLPIFVDGTVAGLLNLCHLTVGFYTEEHFEQLEILVAHATIAIKNAQMYQQLQQLSILEERQRFSRDLHDSLSQMVFSSSIIAETLPILIRKNPEKVDQQLERLRRLNRGAHAELRNLLVELRSASVMEIDLIEVLHQLQEASMGHTAIDVGLVIVGEMNLPQPVQMTFYRIAQEALNNIIKHARATQIDIVLHMETTHSQISIKDNGRGFEQRKTAGVHLGLQNMRERAELVKAVLEIHSTAGKGTEVKVSWQQ